MLMDEREFCFLFKKNDHKEHWFKVIKVQEQLTFLNGVQASWTGIITSYRELANGFLEHILVIIDK